MERKPTRPANPRKFIPAHGIRKPTPYRPPLEARPRITQDIQIAPPGNPVNPPPLTYIKTIPRQVTLANKPRPPVTQPPPLSNTMTTDTTPKEGKPCTPACSVFTAPTATETTLNEPGSSTSQPRVSTTTTAIVAIPDDQKASRSGPNLPVVGRNIPNGKQKAEVLLGGITVRRPKTYKRHFQYVVQRPRLPPVQVTVLNRTFARIRCQGHEKIIRMIDDTEGR